MPLAEFRDRVAAEYQNRKVQEVSQRLFRDLMARYDVRIERPKPEATGAKEPPEPPANRTRNRRQPRLLSRTRRHSRETLCSLARQAPEKSAFPVAEFVRIRRALEGPEVSRLRLRPVGNPASSARGSHPCPLAAIAAGLGLLLAGCHHAVEQAAASDGAAGTPGVARTEVERGPVRVTVEVAPHPVRLSDEPTLTLTLEYESGVQVDKPPFGEAVGDFNIRDFREPLPETGRPCDRAAGLHPGTDATGQLQIDPLAITFTDRGPTATASSTRSRPKPWPSKSLRWSVTRCPPRQLAG